MIEINALRPNINCSAFSFIYMKGNSCVVRFKGKLISVSIFSKCVYGKGTKSMIQRSWVHTGNYGTFLQTTVVWNLFHFVQLGVRSLANASRARQFNPLNPPGVGWVKFFFKVRVSG